MSRVPLLVVLGVFVVCNCFSLPAALADSAEEKFEAIRAVWAEEDEPIDSARIEYLYFLVAEDRLKAITEEEFEHAIEECRRLGGMEGFQHIIDRCTTMGEQGVSPPYSRVVLIQDGRKRRSDTTYDGQTDTLLIEDEHALVTSSANSQVTIQTPERFSLHVPGVDDLRLDPVRVFSGHTLSRCEESQPEIIEAALSYGEGSRVEFLLEIKSDTAELMSRRKTVEGQLVEVREQCDFMTLAGGARLPRVTVTGEFGAGGQLAFLSGYLVEESQLNCQIDAAAFNVTALAGTKVFEHRGNPDQPAFARLAEDTNDVVVRMNGPRPTEEPAGLSIYVRWGLPLVGVTLIVFAVRRLRRRPSDS